MPNSEQKNFDIFAEHMKQYDELAKKFEAQPWNMNLVFQMQEKIQVIGLWIFANVQSGAITLQFN